ncbi:CRM-domain containing factor CFM9, mitochondrial-like [Prosopis cineraria]|uniref:CRM-domain containing factor CFM9, mitochondrial-like n=1 Tax=Prosopis cineraria TaxID=364024 RepID=UPI00240FBE76|nr:CRM-domain containing factor CFM9, mitochondrial-like [Prosopis cineraria]
MFAARNLQRHCLKFSYSILQSNLSKNGISLGPTSHHVSSKVIQSGSEVTSYSYGKPLNSFNISSRTMSTSKGRSMRSKVERRMQKESGKTLREIRRAKKLKKKLMTEEERLIYNLKRAKKKVALLLQKLKKYELPELPSPRHDPELLTPEQLQAYKKIGFRNKNYVPVGVRGVFGGVVQNMHLHWKFHETVQVCCDNFPKEKIKEMATMLARLSGGIVINIHNVKTIIMFRGRNYRQPKNLIPINTLTKRKALFKARFEQALESQKLNIKKIEQQLRRMGVNPEDPAAMASIQRVASTFFNAIDKKEGSPYVFHEGKLSAKETVEDLEEPGPSIDSDQEELDRFIAEIEEAADKEYEAEEAKEKEELGRMRYWNREEFGGRFRKFDVSGNDDHDDKVRGSRFRQTAHAKQQASDSDVENNILSDDDDDDDDYDGEWLADPDSNSDDFSEAKGRSKVSRVDREIRNNFGKTQGNGSSNRDEGELRRNSTIDDSESESMFSDLDNAMWESDEEENESSRESSVSGEHNSNCEDKHAYHTKRRRRNGVRHHGVGGDDSDQNWDGFDVPRNVRGKQGRIGRAVINQRSLSLEPGPEDIAGDSENRLWHSSDSEEEF